MTSPQYWAHGPTTGGATDEVAEAGVIMWTASLGSSATAALTTNAPMSLMPLLGHSMASYAAQVPADGVAKKMFCFQVRGWPAEQGTGIYLTAVRYTCVV